LEAARLLNNWWAREHRENAEVLDALQSFTNFYITNEENNGWFAGFSEFPSTNNATESSNRQFKERETFRRRVPMREFITIAPSYMETCSRSPEHQVIKIIYLM
jgi:hypothetical protein